MTRHKALYWKDDQDRLYMSRKEGERGFDNIEDRIDVLIGIDYKIQERLITAASNTARNMRINRKTNIRKEKLEEKQLYGYFKRQTDKVSFEKNSKRLRKYSHKRETDSILIVAQKNKIRTNYV